MGAGASTKIADVVDLEALASMSAVEVKAKLPADEFPRFKAFQSLPEDASLDGVLAVKEDLQLTAKEIKTFAKTVEKFSNKKASKKKSEILKNHLRAYIAAKQFPTIALSGFRTNMMGGAGMYTLNETRMECGKMAWEAASNREVKIPVVGIQIPIVPFVLSYYNGRWNAWMSKGSSCTTVSFTQQTNSNTPIFKGMKWVTVSWIPTDVKSKGDFGRLGTCLKVSTGNAELKDFIAYPFELLPCKVQNMGVSALRIKSLFVGLDQFASGAKSLGKCLKTLFKTAEFTGLAFSGPACLPAGFFLQALEGGMSWLVGKIFGALTSPAFVEFFMFQIAVVIEYFIRKPLFSEGINLNHMSKVIRGLLITCKICGCRGHRSAQCPGKSDTWWSGSVKAYCPETAFEAPGPFYKNGNADVHGYFAGEIEKTANPMESTGNLKIGDVAAEVAALASK